MRLLLSLILFCACPPAHAIEISNFRSGLACTTQVANHGRGWICHGTQEVMVTDQGSCVFDGVKDPCTWIGFEFDYAGAAKGTKLQCTNETSRPTTSGNPDGIQQADATSHDFELPLDGESGHFVNPMYWVFAVGPEEDALIVDSYTCKADGVVLFKATFNLHFPATQDGAGADPAR